MISLSDEHVALLHARYGGSYRVPELSLGTVRDYCDSCDYLPVLPVAQGDLKDQQRPWMVKALLGLLPAGGRLLEIGGGQPLTAAFLSRLGYEVTLVDPYDGSGFGPVEYEQFTRDYPEVRIIRALFEPSVPALAGERFDGIYSVSVLEHIPPEPLRAVFAATEEHLRPGGCSVHAMDCVLEGDGDEFHLAHAARMARLQAALAETDPDEAASQAAALLARAHRERDVYYLSAEGHNRWRGAMPYDEFPFRRVISVQTAVRREGPDGPVRSEPK